MNRTVVRTSMIGLAVLGSALPLAAQNIKPTVFDIRPYAGYMMFGKLFEGPLGTNVSAGSGPLYGAQASLTMAKNIALYGNVAYSSSDLKVGLPIIGGFDVGNSKALMYDGGVELKIPMQAASAVTPFVQGGVGAIRYEVDAASFLKSKATNVAYNFGGGVDVKLSPNFGVRLMAKDYLGKFDFQEATSFNLNGKTTNNVALSLGVNLGF
jgi:opacity protein-like surface antigen